MTAFENYSESLKKVLGQNEVFAKWPDFEPEFDEQEYAWTTIRGLGESLLLNCGQCDGLSNMRREKCNSCVERRDEIAKKTYEKAFGRNMDKWSAIILCRIHL